MFPARAPIQLAAVTAALLGICSCSEDDTATSTPSQGGSSGQNGGRVLADWSDPSPIPAEDDPLSAHRPETVQCSNLSGWYREEQSLEVDTGECNYLAIAQPAALAAERGDELVIEFSHFDLTSAEPAQAHVAFLAGSEVLWEATWDIPREASVEELVVPLPVDIEKGTPVGIHLHNHGQNSWQFSPMLVR